MPLELIPVLDLRAGRAVHARGGDRAAYEPVHSALAPEAPGDAVALARAYRQRAGAGRCYVADLDAITGGTTQRPLLGAIGAAFGGPLLVDAGLRTVDDLARLAGLDAIPVLGTETLADWGAAEALVAARPATVLSLDVRDGIALGSLGHGEDAVALARRGAALGVRECIVLDLALVGRDAGTALGLVRAVRDAMPGVRLIAGGGVRDERDLERLAAAGADAVLVASALHAGALATHGGQSPTSGIR